MRDTDKTSLVSLLLDKWDDLPNDITSEPELGSVAQVVSKIKNIVDDDEEESNVLDIKETIRNEITWCKGHRGASTKSEDYEDGFIAGLKQVLFFIKITTKS